MSKTVNFTRRKNGEGTIYPIKDGRIGASISLGKDENGKRLRHTVTGKTEEEVIQKMQLWLAQNGYLSNEDVMLNGQSTVEEFIEDFKVNHLLCTDITSRTYENYGYIMQSFKKYFSGRPMASIDADQLNKFFRDLSNAKIGDSYKYSDTSLKRLYRLMNRMFNRAVEKEYLPKNPMSSKTFKRTSSKKKTEEIEGFTEEELETIRNALQSNRVVYPVIALMSCTGMRTQEALALRWKDIDFETMKIHINNAITLDVKFDSHGNKIGESSTILSTTKTEKSQRVLPISAEVVEMLEYWKNTAGTFSKTKTGSNDYVFGNRMNPSWTYDGFRASVNRTLRNSEEDIDRMRLHRLRHTVATKISEQPGATVFDIMYYLGQVNIKTAQKYIDRDTEQRAEKAKVFADQFAANGCFLGKKESGSENGSKENYGENVG